MFLVLFQCSLPQPIAQMQWIFEHKIYYVSCQRLKCVQALKTRCQVVTFYTDSVFAGSRCQALLDSYQ